MVVAAGAVDGQAQKALPHGPNHVLEFVLADYRAHGGALLLLADRVEATGYKKTRGGDAARVLRAQDIASQLSASELVIRQVVVKGLNDPVAVGPSIGAQLIMLEAIA